MKHFYIVRKDTHGIWIDEWNGITNVYNSIKNNPASYIIEGNTLSTKDIETAMIKSLSNRLEKAIKEGKTTLKEITTLIGE